MPPQGSRPALAALRGSIGDNPHQFGKPLVGELAGVLSARRGDYRIIYETDDQANLVVVHRVRRRGDAYGRR